MIGVLNSDITTVIMTPYGFVWQRYYFYLQKFFVVYDSEHKIRQKLSGLFTNQNN